MVFPLRVSRPPARSKLVWADESPEREDGGAIDFDRLNCSTVDPEETFQQAAIVPDKIRTAWVEDVNEHIPVAESGELPSIGSIAHADGKCQPCLFWFQLTCKKGVLCTYCHIAHPGLKKKRIRLSKKVRLELQAMQGVEDPLSQCSLTMRYGDWAAKQARPTSGFCPKAPAATVSNDVSNVMM